MQYGAGCESIQRQFKKSGASDAAAGNHEIMVEFIVDAKFSDAVGDISSSTAHLYQPEQKGPFLREYIEC